MNKLLLSFIVIFTAACATTEKPTVSKELVDLSTPEQHSLLSQYWLPKVKVEPKYPSKAKRKGESRCLDIVFSIDSEGKTSGYAVRNAVPDDEFVQNVARAISHWRWQVSDANPEKLAVLTSTRIHFIAEPTPKVDIFGECG